MTDTDLIVDLFAGPGGWSEGLRLLGLADIGFEWDAAACATRAAAGHRTIRADVAAWPIERLAGRVRGLIASPPCQLFSTAGQKHGRGAIELIAAGLRDLADGRDTRAMVRAEATLTITAGLHQQIENSDLTDVERVVPWQQAIDDAPGLAYNACLVLEPARWAFTLEPEWIALEQVPAVLPLWHELASLLRRKGYRTWTGILNAADYGVPQTRRRAILMAHRTRPLAAPEPTHAEKPEPTLFGDELEPWVTMADALGWGPGRVGFPRRDDLGTSPDGYRERDWTSTDEPAPALTEKARAWELQPGGWGATAHKRRRYRADQEPAPTLAFGNDFIGWRWFELEGDESLEESPGIEWVDVRRGGEDGPGSRLGEGFDPREEPAQTVTGRVDRWQGRPADLNTGRDWPASGDRADAQTRSSEEPAPTVSGQTDAWEWQSRRNDQSGVPVDLEWPEHRPATTIAGRGLVTDPGANSNRFNTSDKSRNDGYRVTIGEAAILQSFHPRYPWQGSRTKQFEQVGNAVPPLLAAHVAHALVKP